MSNLIIDVTQLIEWPGKLTGIPRVMDELSRRFAEEGDATFTAWNRVTRHLQLVEPVKLQREQSSAPVAPRAEAAGFKRVIKKFESSSPLAKKVLHYPRRVVHTMRQARHAEQQQDTYKLTPKKGDILLVLWGDWADDSYLDYLVRLHEDGVRIVQVVYDMLPLVTPQFSGHSTKSLDRYARAIYPISSLLLSISQYTAEDVAAWLKERKLSVPTTKVIRLGDDFHTAKPVKPTTEAFKKAELAKDSYILCVGTFEARKNHTLLYYTYKLAAQRGIILPKLAIVGRRGWKTDDLYELITLDPETKDHLIFLENIGDSELAWLYKNCLFSVYPSFYEGWGLPIAESIAYGVPCICSNTSSMPEIAGDLLTYFSPVSTDECLAAIQAMLNEKNRKKAIAKIKRYKPTSWDQTYNQVKEYLEGVKV